MCVCVFVCAAGKLPYGFLDNSAGGAGSGVVGGLDSSSLEKQLALSAMFGGAAGLAALTGATERVEVYSRKVFVGGLPPDIDEGAFLYSQCSRIRIDFETQHILAEF